MLFKRIAEVEPELIALRRDFHRHPELGMEEVRTGRIVTDYLRALGVETACCNKTGVVGALRGVGPGPTILLRADMDALPVQEETGLPFASERPGVMHACGHDAHTAMLLAAAKILAPMREEFAGNILFVFQPNEENVGALDMVREGVLDAPRVDGCMGLHVWNPLPAGQIGLTAGPVMAGMVHFELTIKGRGGHTATPQSAVDPILTAAAVIQATQSIQTRELDALKEPTVIMFGRVHGGSATNVIPDSVQLSGTMRYMFEGPDDSPENPKNRFERVIAGVCAAHRAGYELEFKYGHPTLVNDAAMTSMIQTVLADEIAPRMDQPPLVTPLVTLAGEDFSEFASRRPGVFVFLGAGYPDRVNHPHHHPCFDIDESVLAMGVELHVRSALRFLREARLSGPTAGSAY